MATANSSNKAVDETPQEDYIWIEWRLLQSIVLQSRLGQTVLKLTDYFLWIVEKCTEWSLPRQNIEDEKDLGKRKTELVRPLPWLLFLPSLMILRIIRVTVNISASLLNYPIITPSKMLRLVQKSRRYLHDAMKRDKKERCEFKDKRSSMNEAKKALIRSIRLTLSSLSCLDTSKPSPSPPPTKIYISINLDPDPVTTTSEEKSEKKSVTESMAFTSTSKHSTSESEEEKEEKEEKEKEQREETLKEKIDRLALENSEDDESFKPDSSSDANSTDDDDENSDGDLSPNEIHDIVEVTVEKEKSLKKKVAMEFLNVELTSMSTSEQEPIELVCEKRSSAKESRDKVEEHFATSQRIDSSECCTSSQEGEPIFYSPISSDSDSDTLKEPSISIAKQCASRKILKTKEFINGEARFFSASTISDSKSSKPTNTDAVVEKRSTNMNKSYKGKRTSRGNAKKK